MVLTERVPDSLQGVVLAGGASTRFGSEDKALAWIGSQSILDRVLDVLSQATVQESVVVVRTREQQATYARAIDRTDVQFVFDAPAYEGPLAGIVGAAATLDSQWLFCCGCDMPLLAPSAVRWLAAQIGHDRTNGQQQVDAVAIEHPDGTVEPLHTVYHRESVIELKKSLPRTAGPRLLLSELENVRTVSTADAPEGIPLDTSVLNVNTHEELDAIRNRM